MSNCVQAITTAAEQSGFTYPEANALQTEMLERLLVGVYSKLNRTCCNASVTYQPQPPRRRLPDKAKLKRDVLEQVSGMPNPPWEPPSRDDGLDEANELHRIHVQKHLIASLDSVNLHNRTEAVSEGSLLLMAMAEDIFDMVVMEAVHDIMDVDTQMSKAAQ